VCAVDQIKSQFSSRRILTSAASRLEFVTERNHADNLQLYLTCYVDSNEVCFVCYEVMHKHLSVWMPWRPWMLLLYIPLCSVNKHSTVWWKHLKHSRQSKVRQSAVLCDECQRAFYFKVNRTKFIRFGVLHWKWFDNVLLLMLWQMKATLHSMWENMQNCKGQKENFWMW
jgi:hypothetical protein